MLLDRKIDSLNKSLNTNKAKKELLESITRAYKKDGTDFSSLGNNFKSTREDITVKVVNDPFSLKSKAKRLLISGYCDGKYISEEIDISPCVDYVDFEVSPDRIIKDKPYVKSYVVLKPDEIMHEISLRINVFNKWINDEEETLSKLKEYTDVFLPRVKDILREVNDVCGDNGTLLHDIKEILREEF